MLDVRSVPRLGLLENAKKFQFIDRSSPLRMDPLRELLRGDWNAAQCLSSLSATPVPSEYPTLRVNPARVQEIVGIPLRVAAPGPRRYWLESKQLPA